jgi:hypothetical protein
MKFDPQQLPLKDEDARALLDDVIDDVSVLSKMYGDWEDLLKAYKLGPGRKSMSGGKQGISLVSSVIQSMKPYLFNSDPAIYAKAKKLTQEGDEDIRAKLTEAALTYQWDEAGMRDEVNKLLDDTLIFGASFARVGYEPSGEFVPLEDYDRDTDIDDWVEDPEVQTLRDRMEELGLTPDTPTACVTLKRWSPFNVAFPAGYDEIGKMPRFSFRHLLPIDMVKGSDKFHNTGHLEADKVIANDGKGKARATYQSVYGSSKAGHVEVWEIFHVEYRKRLVMRDGKKARRTVREMHVTWLCDQANTNKKGQTVTVLKNHISAMDMEGYPVIDLRFARCPDAFFGLSLAAQILPIAEWIQDLVESGVEGLQAAMNLKTLYNPDKLGKNGVELLASARPAMVPVKDKLGVGNAVANLIMPAFPQEFQSTLGLLNALISRVSGSDEVVQGGRSSAGSATEVAFRASVLQGRSQYNLKTFESFLQKTMRKVLQLMQQYFEAERWVRITGIEAPVSFTRSSIRGEFDVGIHAGSTRPRTPQDERQAVIGFLEYLGTAANAMQMAGVPQDVMGSVFGKVADIWDQNLPALVDSFAAMASGAVASAVPGMPPPGMSPPGDTASGAASGPEGESLNIPAAGRLQAVAAQGGTPGGGI